jgi:shikimate kinase
MMLRRRKQEPLPPAVNAAGITRIQNYDIARELTAQKNCTIHAEAVAEMLRIEIEELKQRVILERESGLERARALAKERDEAIAAAADAALCAEAYKKSLIEMKQIAHAR